ncbi:unnamed protein product, partial [Phaeothamnion confervicola]
PLIIAASLGYEGILQDLLAGGASTDSRDARRATALHWACADDHVACCRALIAAGADVTAGTERSPLHEAAAGGHLLAVKELLKSGAAVDVRDGAGRSPLHAAAGCADGSAGVVRALLAAGADPAAGTRSGETPLHVACS